MMDGAVARGMSKDWIASQNPQNRLVQPDEVGALVAFCCSDASPRADERRYQSERRCRMVDHSNYDRAAREWDANHIIHPWHDFAAPDPDAP